MATNEELSAQIQAGAVEAMAELWKKNLNLVKSTVRRVSGLSERDSGFEDLEQQAFFGFRAAVYAFNPGAGVKFSTYAAKRIEWELCRYYERNGYTVHIPSYMQRRIRDCLEQKRQMEAAVGHSVSYAAALEALHLPPAVVTGTLAAFSRLKTVNLDAEAGISILDMLADETDMEELVIGQEWHRELHELLIKALEELPEEAQGIIRRHYFGGVSIARMAVESGQRRQTLYYREAAAFRAIRTGQYGAALSEFFPSIGGKARANRLIRHDRVALQGLELSQTEKEMLAL